MQSTSLRLLFLLFIACTLAPAQLMAQFANTAIYSSSGWTVNPASSTAIDSRTQVTISHDLTLNPGDPFYFTECEWLTVDGGGADVNFTLGGNLTTSGDINVRSANGWFTVGDLSARDVNAGNGTYAVAGKIRAANITSTSDIHVYLGEIEVFGHTDAWEFRSGFGNVNSSGVYSTGTMSARDIRLANGTLNVTSGLLSARSIYQGSDAYEGTLNTQDLVLTGIYDLTWGTAVVNGNFQANIIDAHRVGPETECDLSVSGDILLTDDFRLFNAVVSAQDVQAADFWVGQSNNNAKRGVFNGRNVTASGHLYIYQGDYDATGILDANQVTIGQGSKAGSLDAGTTNVIGRFRVHRGTSNLSGALKAATVDVFNNSSLQCTDLEATVLLDNDYGTITLSGNLTAQDLRCGDANSSDQGIISCASAGIANTANIYSGSLSSSGNIMSASMDLGRGPRTGDVQCVDLIVSGDIITQTSTINANLISASNFNNWDSDVATISCNGIMLTGDLRLLNDQLDVNGDIQSANIRKSHGNTTANNYNIAGGIIWRHGVLNALGSVSADSLLMGNRDGAERSVQFNVSGDLNLTSQYEQYQGNTVIGGLTLVDSMVVGYRTTTLTFNAKDVNAGKVLSAGSGTIDLDGDLTAIDLLVGTLGRDATLTADNLNISSHFRMDRGITNSRFDVNTSTSAIIGGTLNVANDWTTVSALTGSYNNSNRSIDINVGNNLITGGSYEQYQGTLDVVGFIQADSLALGYRRGVSGSASNISVTRQMAYENGTMDVSGGISASDLYLGSDRVPTLNAGSLSIADSLYQYQGNLNISGLSDLGEYYATGGSANLSDLTVAKKMHFIRLNLTASGTIQADALQMGLPDNAGRSITVNAQADLNITNDIDVFQGILNVDGLTTATNAQLGKDRRDVVYNLNNMSLMGDLNVVYGTLNASGKVEAANVEVGTSSRTGYMRLDELEATGALKQIRGNIQGRLITGDDVFVRTGYIRASEAVNARLLEIGEDDKELDGNVISDLINVSELMDVNYSRSLDIRGGTIHTFRVGDYAGRKSIIDFFGDINIVKRIETYNGEIRVNGTTRMIDPAYEISLNPPFSGNAIYVRCAAFLWDNADADITEATEGTMGVLAWQSCPFTLPAADEIYWYDDWIRSDLSRTAPNTSDAGMKVVIKSGGSTDALLRRDAIVAELLIEGGERLNIDNNTDFKVGRIELEDNAIYFAERGSKTYIDGDVVIGAGANFLLEARSSTYAQLYPGSSFTQSGTIQIQHFVYNNFAGFRYFGVPFKDVAGFKDIRVIDGNPSFKTWPDSDYFYYTFDWDGANDTWVVPSWTNPLVPGKGYRLYFGQEGNNYYFYNTLRGNDNNSNRKITISGTINSTDFTHSVQGGTINPNDVTHTVAAGQESGWVFLSNPYPFDIDLDKFLADNETVIYSEAKYYAQNGGTERGSYASAVWSYYTKDNVVSDPNHRTDRYHLNTPDRLAPFQGFMVRLKDISAPQNIEFKLSQGYDLPAPSGKKSFMVPLEKLGLEFFGESDTTRLSLFDENEFLNSSYDMPVYMQSANDSLAVYSSYDGGNYNAGLVSRDRPTLIGVQSAVEGQAILLGLDQNSVYEGKVMLKDLHTGLSHDLSAGAYSFVSSLNDLGRFELAMDQTTLDDELETAEWKIRAFKQGNGLRVMIEGMQGPVLLSLIDSSGRTLLQNTVEQADTVLDCNLNEGMHLLYAQKADGSSKIIKVLN